MKNLERIK